MLINRCKIEVYKFGDRSIFEKESGKVENILNHLKRNKRNYRTLVTIIAIMMMSGHINPIFAADVNQAIAKIDSLGRQLLNLFQTIAYWAVIISTTRDGIKDAICGDRKAVMSSVTKGIIIMATIYYLPELFDLMKSIVSQNV